MPYSIQRFKTYGSRTLTVGDQYVLTDFGLPKNAMITSIGIRITSVINDAVGGAGGTVQEKEILSCFGVSLACGAPVSATIFQGDGRLCRLAESVASAQYRIFQDPTTVAAGPSTVAWNRELTIPFSFPGKRSKDWNLANCLESLTITCNAAPSSIDPINISWASVAVVPVVYYYLAESVAFGPVPRWRAVSTAEDTRAFSGKLVSLTSLCPLTTTAATYPACTVSVDGEPQYQITQGFEVFSMLANSYGTPNAATVLDGSGEGLCKFSWALDGGSVLDCSHRTVELSYLTSLSTALGGSDTVAVCDLVSYAKPDGSVKVAETGKSARGALENLPVESL